VTKRISILALVAVAALALPAGSAVATSGPAATAAAKSKGVAGFYRGRALRYLDLGVVKLAKGNKVAPLWTVTNAAAGQHNVIDVVPGRRGYTPLWRVVKVTWKAGAKPRVLRSRAAVEAAVRAGEATLERTSTIVNCPVLGFGQKATAGFVKERAVKYLDLGPLKLAKGNKLAPLWAFTNGAAGQRNIIDVLPGAKGYTPLWRVTMVTWKDGVTPRVLRSRAAVEAAMAAGELTLKRTATVVNCPVI